ncbi:intermembrane phospholipid transport protein YdbH family protein, partial [Rodentibacter caecimuris]|uniref:intermembrane phospholipid transport protein YdbH family protein n=1 Tax=Rodentibacter caecimuris TaxID=1796644 RepID=UPI0025828840
LNQVMTMAQYNQIHLEGRMNATLPFWLNHPACLICDGTLQQADKMRIKLNDEVANGLKKGGLTESILVNLLKEMELQNAHANIHLAPNGQMNLRAGIKGFNLNNPNHAPITLNYHHQENMFELWNMIDYGAQFEQNLQYRLYQDLEHEKTR